ncbi:hypothetical protein QN219_14370 [Sinorhizobium sp. 7-81]|uniref:hypothetical protein n=1 Tax=Sinorhizobium sp. 8-89 TaxID=3049089 RepID=UPI0024C266E5|nr:hypothetical protein [Sinorhizobium sp. 8-89]MDK1491239.1 hypothetical protein [Sinorhizobium sp. 8-89]
MSQPIDQRCRGNGSTLACRGLRLVVNWRTLEIFLYGWWPIVRRHRLYRRLAAATVNVLSVGSFSPSSDERAN